MDLYVIRRPSAWASLKEVEAIGAKSAKIGNDEMSDRVRWIRSYVVKEPDGRFGSVCIYQARADLPRGYHRHRPRRSERGNQSGLRSRRRPSRAASPLIHWILNSGRALISPPKGGGRSQL